MINASILRLVSVRSTHARIRSLAASDDPALQPFLKLAVRRFPREAEFRVRLGDSLVDEDPEGAVEQFLAAVTLEPDFGPTVFRVAYGLFRAEALHEAEAYTNLASSLIDANDSFYPNLLHLRGLLAARRHQFEVAVELFREATELQRDSAPFWLDLVVAIATCGRIAEARALIDDVASTVPNFKATWARKTVANIADADV